MRNHLEWMGHWTAVMLLATSMVPGLTGCPTPLPDNPHFSIILLDPREAEAFALNEKCEVAGYLTYAEQEAFVWRPDYTPELTTLGSLGGASFAYDINIYSEVCGVARVNDFLNHAFRWTEATGMQDLRPTALESNAYGINDRGEIVGQADGPNGMRAFIWAEEDGMATVFGAEPDSYAEKINLFSNIVGTVKENDVASAPQESRIWREGDNPIFITNPWAGRAVRARAVNDALTAVGWFEDKDYARYPMKWSHAAGIEKLQTLGFVSGFQNLPGPWAGDAYGINFHGDIVGTVVSEESTFTAVLWRQGSVFDLNKLIPEGTPWINLDIARDINNKGCITGIGTIKTAKQHAFLLVPVVLISVSTTPVAAVGGEPILVHAVLDGDAPCALDIEAAISGLPRVAQLASSVATVPEGARSAEFRIETVAVDTEQTGDVEVSFGGTSLTTRLSVRPR